jgi:diguanylate cyclase (GGDEF)-like protein
MTLSVRGLTRNVAVIEAACLLAALAGSLALVLAIHEVRAATALTEHSDRVLLRSNDLERKVVDLETGLRGYAITRDHVFLRPMLAAQKGIPDELTDLQQLVGGDAAQERRAQAISGAVWTYARYWLQPALQLHESDSALAAQMWASVGRERMETIRHRFAAFETAERTLRNDRAHRLSTDEGVVVGLLVAVLLALAAAAALAVRRLRGSAVATVVDLTAQLEASDARNDELVEELERQSGIDRLTGIANREGFAERLDEECTAARRHCGDLSLLRLEIEGLGELYANHGYAAGNAVVLRVVALCTAQVRSGDAVARIGGDELAILLPRTPARGAEVVVDALRRKLEAEAVTAGPATIPLRVAIGAASAAHGAEPDALLHDAGLDLDRRRSPGDALEQNAA